MKHIRTLGFLLLFLAGVFSALGILSLFPQPPRMALTVWLRLSIFGVAALIFLAGLVVFEAGRREMEAEEALSWLRDFQDELLQLRYPLNANAIRPVSARLAAFFPEREGWVLLFKVPGTLVQGEVLRSQYLEIVSYPDEKWDTAVVESRLRDELGGEAVTWQARLADPNCEGREVGLWMRQSASGEVGVGVALALPSASRWPRRAALTHQVFDTALHFLVQHIEVLQADLINQREKIGNEGIGYRIRALVHEMARELQGAYYLIDRLEPKTPQGREAQASLIAYLSRAVYWLHLFRDMPYFQDQWLPLDRKPLLVSEVLGCVLEEAHQAWPELVISVKINTEMPVIADEHLNSVFRNLVYNAASFSPLDAPVSISVNQTGRFVSVMVRDQGPGVSPEQADAIFTPGVGYDRPLYPRGMGVGLTIARDIARAYGGDLVCTPRDAKHSGGCFEVFIPIKEEP